MSDRQGGSECYEPGGQNHPIERCTKCVAYLNAPTDEYEQVGWVYPSGLVWRELLGTDGEPVYRRAAKEIFGG